MGQGLFSLENSFHFLISLEFRRNVAMLETGTQVLKVNQCLVKYFHFGSKGFILDVTQNRAQRAPNTGQGFVELRYISTQLGFYIACCLEM